MVSTEQRIQSKAYELGYIKCGIVSIEELEEYERRLEERMEKVPEASKKFYERQKRLTNTKIREQFPWARSAVVVAAHYGRYKIPETLKGHIAKYYLFDFRVRSEKAEYERFAEMEDFLGQLGLQTASNQKFGVFSLRWAAMKAGLGVIRNNNFFYTEHGSWVNLDGWLIDQKMELRETARLPACPPGCTRCVSACPSGSLSARLTMSPCDCISYLTTFGGRDLPKDAHRGQFGPWIYGCDACQDACPMNKGKWEEKYEYSGLKELELYLSLEEILNMDEEFYKRKIQPKFFYIGADELWKWKVNVLCYMRNNYQESYKPSIAAARESENEKVREMARLVSEELHIA
ncbi:epoxyqueuosine reductase [Papillibacter cinnamivorans]|uniref:Epoxyqueuosine reductase n=1 Tax=Papillibacter cinnamivorans DSM 12816 TaxID=1122930 RepID=A0A1W2CUG9_9FIRM|nr:4Fe-4S double cluster binding domain-containing protein [Papillibacter cinnamivorans]SMC88851.1 epoxyqueuosine reductase [Papillibacter cinnamivorans DSM 12816]